jgi:alpha-methylacyl-CoA racemase
VSPRTGAAGKLPLEEIKVVEFASLLPGPACGQWLVALGAEVTKIEPPGGDPARTLYGGRVFDAVNAGKNSVILDLKGEDGSIALDMVRSADVLIEGFRPGVADRLGLGESDVRPINPNLIYCSLVGYDPDGAQRDEPSHDLLFLAQSGVLEIPGSWGAGGPGDRPGLPLGDLAGAAIATSSILAALFARSNGGGGARLVVPIYDALLSWVGIRARPGEGGPITAHLDPANDVYRCRDGRRVAVAAVEDKFWGAFCDLVGGPVEHLRGLGWAERQERGSEIAAGLRAVFEQDDAKSWADKLIAAGVPAALVRRPGEAMADPTAYRATHGYPLPNFGYGGQQLRPPPRHPDREDDHR